MEHWHAWYWRLSMSHKSRVSTWRKNRLTHATTYLAHQIVCRRQSASNFMRNQNPIMCAIASTSGSNRENRAEQRLGESGTRDSSILCQIKNLWLRVKQFEEYGFKRDVKTCIMYL